MKKLAVSLFITALIAAPAIASPHNSDKGNKANKHSEKVMERDTKRFEKENREEYSTKGDRNRDDDREKVKERERIKEHKPDDDKLYSKKADQERKELGKGSEQGQASREEHSRKWWRFWE
jgi:hypothetical protein